MDGRGYRTLLALAVGGMVGVGGAGSLRSQPPPSAPTPWVQAPPAASMTPAPTPTPTPTPGGTPLAPVAKGKPTAPTGFNKKPGESLPGGMKRGGPGGTPAPSFPVASEEIKARMQRERQAELERGREEQSPDEEQRRTFEQNLELWNKLTPMERRAIREQVGPRIREETEAAYQESGLNLDNDQREIFDLRYRQERRKVERQAQEAARRERERLLPPVIERLRKEFGRVSNADNAPKAAPKPVATATPSVSAPPTPTPTPKAVPSATASPGASKT